MHLQFKPGLRRVWREAGSLQIGLSRRRGTVLNGLAPADLRLLERLREGVDPADLGAYDEPDAVRGRDVLQLLMGAGVLIRHATSTQDRERLGPAVDRLAPDAAIWSMVHPQVGDGWRLLADRASRRVLVRGAGRLGTMLASTLACAGVGQVAIQDGGRVTAGDVAPAGAGVRDVGRPREDAAGEAVQRCGGKRARLGSIRANWAQEKVDLVVLIEHGAADAGAAGELLSADVPHLSVVIREDDVVVGPLVRPGIGPCLRCLDLHRTDRDPAWPSVLAQLLNPSTGTLHPEETASAMLAAGLAGLQVLAQLDGTGPPAAAGATLEVELPDGLIARRPWPAHPSCGCHWPPRAQAAVPVAPGMLSRNPPHRPDPPRATDRGGARNPAGARGSPLAARMRP